ncbi:hypothetical protein Aab01nite_48630 [Paractinoplanes abujensis]|nr:hypothetical protein Aab01nite_48630 [Actinoplanes abujensis]
MGAPCWTLPVRRAAAGGGAPWRVWVELWPWSLRDPELRREALPARGDNAEAVAHIRAAAGATATWVTCPTPGRDPHHPDVPFPGRATDRRHHRGGRR